MIVVARPKLTLQGAVCGLLLMSMHFVGDARAAGGDKQATSIVLTGQIRARCLEILRSSLQSNEFWPSMHAAEALTLAGYGAEVRQNLPPRLKTQTDDRHRCGLARELVRAGDDSAAAIMLDILAREDPYGHVHACESLFKCGRTGDGRLLRKAMQQQENPTLAIMAAAALGRSGSREAMQLLREKLTDGDPEVSRIAAWVLTQIGDSSDLAQLRKNLATLSSPMARAYHEHALACLGDPQGLKALAHNLQSGDPGIRVHAAHFAGEARAVELGDMLVGLLDDPDLDVRIRAAQSLLVLARADEAPGQSATEPGARPQG